MADLFNNSGDFLQTLGNSRNQYNGIQAPNLTWNTYSPEQIAARSAQAQTVSDDPLAKSAQMSALSRMGDLAQNGLSAVDQQGFENARELGNQMANSGSQAAMANAQARGIGGSAMEFANREIANQQGAQREGDRQAHDQPHFLYFEIRRAEIRQVGGRRSDNNDGGPIIGFVHRRVATLRDKDEGEQCNACHGIRHGVGRETCAKDDELADE